MNPSTPPSRLSTTTFTSSFDGKRQPKLKESSFLFKHGQRHHSYDSEKAPYPVSYDRDVLELESLDNRIIMSVQNSVSFIDFKDGPPTRSLDLGCGCGNWVVEAAKQWPECEFVGFDLVNVQVPLKLLDKSMAERITWVHGNFLTTKLPFEDDEFDFVHVKAISQGVPENKWGVLFEEINRVLRPGGAIEVCEYDILFPVLPRWFTTPLRTRPSVQIDNPENIPTPPITPPQNVPPHDHALLESLYLSVFESRFINLRPTAVIPAYFTTYFRHVVLGPVINFPMPPLPPLQPIPPQIVSSFASEILEAQSSSTSIPQSAPTTRPASLSFSSTMSCSTTSTAVDSTRSSISNEINDDETLFTANRHHIYRPVDSSVGDPIYASASPDLVQGALDEVNLNATTNERSMVMHLYRAYQTILACQEAMWDELNDRIRNKKDDLTAYGWDGDEELEGLPDRDKFERLVNRYSKDMQTRISLWCSLSRLGWPLPPREPLSKAELIEERRIHQGMLEARQVAAEDIPCRTGRIFKGYKGF